MRARNRALQLAFVCCSPLLLFSQNTDKVARPASLTAPPGYGSCPAPQDEGISLCEPYDGASIDTPFQVIASATSGSAQVSHIELWADGKKVTQASGTPFDEPITLSSGTHRLTLIEIPVISPGYLTSKTFHVTVQGNDGEKCPPPGAAGVNVCDPRPNSCHTSPWVTVVASGTGFTNNPIVRMELWVNNGKVANFPGNLINTNLYVSDFSTITIYAVDSKGGYAAASPPIVVQSC